MRLPPTLIGCSLVLCITMARSAQGSRVVSMVVMGPSSLVSGAGLAFLPLPLYAQPEPPPFVGTV